MQSGDSVSPPRVRRLNRRRVIQVALRASLILAMLTLAMLLAVVYGHRQPVELPRPDGPYAAGRVVRTVTFSQPDVKAGAPPLERVLWCWYPATPDANAVRADYWPPAWRGALEQHRGVLINTVANRDLARVRSYSLDGVPVATSASPLPVVLLRAGLAALTADYTSLAEHLASHGYVVVGMDVPGRTALVVLSDGRVVTRPVSEDPERLSGAARTKAVDQLIDAWTEDLIRLADGLLAPGAWLPELEGRLDATRLSVVGHSLGGATAAEFCRRDVRCDVGVDLDGALGSRVVSEGVPHPFAFVLSDHGTATDAESQAIAAGIQSVFDRLPSTRRWLATIRGANHFSFSDQMLVRNPVPLALLRGFGVLALDPRRGLEVSAETVHRLLNSRRGSEPQGSLDIRTDDIPEVVRP